MDSASAFDSLAYLLPQHDLPSSGPTTAAAAAAAAASGAAPRGSKKRARASRRAPTTVLTTDASNFRAMVQEFTGIPSPPFPTTTSSSTSPSSSLHLLLPTRPRFEPPSSLNPSNYLLRPFSSSSFSSSTLTATTASTPTPTPTPFVVPLHLQYPILTFQSLLQSQVLLPPPPPTEYAPGVMDLPPGLNGPTGWATNGPVSSCKMNYTTPAAAEFAVEKVSAESVATAAAPRGEGMVESWICSAD